MWAKEGDESKETPRMRRLSCVKSLAVRYSTEMRGVCQIHVTLLPALSLDRVQFGSRSVQVYVLILTTPKDSEIYQIGVASYVGKNLQAGLET